MCVVAHNFWAVLVCLCIKKSVEAIKAASKWPTVKGASWSSFGEWSDMPFTHHVVAVSVWTQHLGQCASFFCNLSAVARKATIEVR